MKNIAMTAVVCGMVAVSAAVPGAQERHRPEPRHFAGLLNDHTPSAAVVAKGPYEMRGKWSLDVDEARGTATFTAAMDMQTSDYGIIQGTVNKDDPSTRGAHTHHISMTDGVLTLDMPPEEGDVFRAAFGKAGIDTIFLLSPTTTAERIRRASELGSGFLYGISRLGVTGVRDTVDDSARELAERVKSETRLPLALGFGISRPEHVRSIGQWADAAVVGSALVKVIAEHGQKPELLDEVERYVRWLRN